MKIPIYKLEFEKDFITKFKEGCEDILLSDGLSEDKWVRSFEKKFAKLVNCKHAIATTSGTSALELALKSVGVKGKEVIIPSNTFFATSIAVSNSGGTISLVDIEEDNFSICPNALQKKISEKTAAVILVHIGGIISKNIEKIHQICDDNNVVLVEDAAHAHCSKRNGAYAGTIGDIGCFSFFPTKVMTTGEGGMITTNNNKIYEKIKSLKNFGRDLKDGGICVLGSGQNAKINEFTGLLGFLECSRVISRIEKRNLLMRRYSRNLEGTHYNIVRQDEGYCSYYKCIIKTKINRVSLREYCKKRGVSLTGEVYAIPVHCQPLYKDVFKNESFPVTEKVCKHHICPPLYPELELCEIDYICDVLISAEKDLL